MNDLNSILIEGNLTRDPVLTSTPTGTSVCNFAVATHHMYRKEEQQQRETSFFDVEVWAKLAENCAQHLKKGRGVRVVGRLKQDRWKTGEGHPRSRIKIVAEHVEFRPMKKRVETNPEPIEEANAILVAEGVIDEEPAPAEEELTLI